MGKIAVVLSIIFMVLKLTEVIAWSWLWVLSPLWIFLLIWISIFLVTASVIILYIIKHN